WLALASVPILLCVGLGAVTLPEWEKKPLSFGPYEPSRLGAGPEALTRPNDQLLYFREGRTATIAVTQKGEARSLIINGRANASDTLGDMTTQVMLAEIPLLLAEHAEDVLVVGWGSGVTVGSVLRGGAKRVTAFEIEPAVLEASHFFDRVNHQPLRDPRLTVYLGDGRHILRASDATYDAIISYAVFCLKKKKRASQPGRDLLQHLGQVHHPARAGRALILSRVVVAMVVQLQRFHQEVV